ncbi:Tfp pilus assembly protein FimT/FimU [Campylobacter fetus]|uniref:pilus assembly FimT family protein n=1 Tax=Campylobacter fetus TaxID=196 RepID=UPI00081890D3|nr:prepilin-type N-terminal cleavage/methylation domain-containing protein [Campylobacter fetus]AVK80885.1 prepilin-type N-terminal cleavage/methylation domain-containing protein [Campylobacter fetus subsp. testudinum]
MKKAFTLIELVIVLVIVGIMAFFTVPKLNRNDLRLAADQIVSHIRYTQHLAIIDDKFNQSDPDWYKKRWIFEFTNINTQNKIKGICENTNCWRYNVYSDKTGSTNLNSIGQAAKDPENSSKRLTAGFSPNSMSNTILKQLNLKLNLTHTYNINAIKFSDGCLAQRSNVGIKIRFDELGLPYDGNPDKPYGQSFIDKTTGKVSPCTIKLIHTNNDCIFIKVTPITGFAYVELAASKADCNK